MCDVKELEWDTAWLEVSSLDVNLWTEEDYEKEARWDECVFQANARLDAKSTRQPHQ